MFLLWMMFASGDDDDDSHNGYDEHKKDYTQGYCIATFVYNKSDDGLMMMIVMIVLSVIRTMSNVVLDNLGIQMVSR